MINRESTRHPIASFPLPSNVPDSVKPAAEKHARLGSQWVAMKEAIREAERAVVQAEADDIKAAADAYGGGKEPGDPVHQPKAEEQLEELRRKFAALSIATDAAGNEVARAIGPEVDAWASSFDAVVDEQTERYRNALAEALDAITELGRVKAAREWLAEWDTGQAIAGRVRTFHGGSAQFRVVRPLSLTDAPSAVQLLELAAKALDPPPVHEAKLKREALERAVASA